MQPDSRFSPRRVLRAASWRATRSIATHLGERFPMWFVSEYPKSGGTWLGRMIADYLGLPFPQHRLLPVATAAVVHNHWDYDPRLRRCFYLYRDGRDVTVSLYFHRLRDGTLDAAAASRLGFPGPPDDIAANLPRFIESLRDPASGQLEWARHLEGWCDPRRDGVVYLSYESLLTAPLPTLAAGLAGHGVEVDEERLRRSIERFTFESMTGRARGDEDRSSFLRKGVAGDWRNHFGVAACRAFEAAAGDWLVRLGYEADASWVDTFGASRSQP